MEFAYLKLLKDNNLTVSQLPADTQEAITDLGQIQTGVMLLARKNKEPRAYTLNKIKRLDRWICADIIDHIENTNTNAPAPPVAAEEIKDEIKEQAAATTATAATTVGVGAAAATPEQNVTEDLTLKKGTDVDKELSAIAKEGIKCISLADMKAKAPMAYGVIFENYEKGTQNGLETNNFRVLEIEAEPEHFTIQKV